MVQAMAMYSEGAGCMEAALATGVPLESLIGKILSKSGSRVRMEPVKKRGPESINPYPDIQKRIISLIKSIKVIGN